MHLVRIRTYKQVIHVAIVSKSAPPDTPKYVKDGRAIYAVTPRHAHSPSSHWRFPLLPYL